MPLKYAIYLLNLRAKKRKKSLLLSELLIIEIRCQAMNDTNGKL